MVLLYLLLWEITTLTLRKKRRKCFEKMGKYGLCTSKRGWSERTRRRENNEVSYLHITMNQTKPYYKDIQLKLA